MSYNFLEKPLKYIDGAQCSYFFEGFFLLRNIFILENNISAMLLSTLKLYAPIMEHPTTSQYDFDSVQLKSFFCKKNFNIYIYIYIYSIFHFWTSQPHNVYNLFLLFIPISALLFLLSLLLWKNCFLILWIKVGWRKDSRICFVFRRKISTPLFQQPHLKTEILSRLLLLKIW